MTGSPVPIRPGPERWRCPGVGGTSRGAWSLVLETREEGGEGRGGERRVVEGSAGVGKAPDGGAGGCGWVLGLGTRSAADWAGEGGLDPSKESADDGDAGSELRLGGAGVDGAGLGGMELGGGGSGGTTNGRSGSPIRPFPLEDTIRINYHKLNT